LQKLLVRPEADNKTIMEQEIFTAKLSNIRISSTKLVLVANLVNKMPVEKAITQMSFYPKKGARYVQKLIESAVANAKHNNGVRAKDLVISRIIVGQALTYKRGRPASRGKYSRILKRGSNLTIELAKK